MFRQLLTIMLAMLLWTVQTADLAIDHSKALGDSNTATIAVHVDDSEGSSGNEESGLACSVGCICHALHHACLGDLSASVAQPRIDGEAFVIADCDVGMFLTEPPTRPPLA